METVTFTAPSPARSRHLSPLDPNAGPGSEVLKTVEAIDVDAEEPEVEDRPWLHLEVRLLESSRVRSDTVSRLLQQYIHRHYSSLTENTLLEEEWTEIKLLADNVDEIRIAECADPALAADGGHIALDRVSLAVHIYRATNAPLEEFTAASSQVSQEEAAADGDDVMAATVCDLPTRTFEGLWESLIYEEDIKRRLMNYISATMEFSERDVSFNIISWHRLVLLHGPPGTGKTSLCRALAQKLAIRLSDSYSSGKLVEINAHSLFSKWFSESGKLVQRLFSRVTELCEDESSFVTVLIDEVESLTAARAGAMSGKEPSDALRVVNALLTQLDKLKLRKNVLILTTSNLTAAIDAAFIDRADIKVLIPNPPVKAAYGILASCLRELCRSGLIRACTPLDWRSVEMARATGVSPDNVDAQASVALRALAERCMGMSGRTLRRLPVLAHAEFVMSYGGKSRKDALSWIKAMTAVVQQETIERDLIETP